jgi:WD40 repeat protein
MRPTCIICVFDAETGDTKLNFAAMNCDREVLGGVGTKKNICYTCCEERLGVWDCDMGQCIFLGTTGLITAVSFGQNDDSIIAASADAFYTHTAGELCCWNLIDGSILFKTPASASSRVCSIVLSPYKVGFVTMNHDGIIQEYDGCSGAPTKGSHLVISAYVS